MVNELQVYRICSRGVVLPPFTEEDWLATPKPVRDAFENLEARVQRLINQVEKLAEQVVKLTNQVNKNSKNSSKLPSSDPPFKKSPHSSEKKMVQNVKKGDRKVMWGTSKHYCQRRMK